MAGTAETRVNRKLGFEPEGAAGTTGAPASFRLVALDYPQQRRAPGHWVTTGQPGRTVLADGITRNRLKLLLFEGIDLLALAGADE
jgi:hypothetical protein